MVGLIKDAIILLLFSMSIELFYDASSACQSGGGWFWWMKWLRRQVRKRTNIIFYGRPFGMGRLGIMLSSTRKKVVWKFWDEEYLDNGVNKAKFNEARGMMDVRLWSAICTGQIHTQISKILQGKLVSKWETVCGGQIETMYHPTISCNLRPERQVRR